MLGVMSEGDTGFAALDRSGEERFQSLRTPLGLRSFGMNLIVLQPGQRGRIHAHDTQEEVYLVLEGVLTLLIEGESRVLEADQLVRVAPHVRRQLVNASNVKLVLLALGGSGEHAGRDGRAWEDWQATGEGRAPQDVPLPADLPRG